MPASACSPPASDWPSCACSTAARTSPTGCGTDRPDWLRPAVGGVLLGLLLLAVPEMYGVGYPVLQNAVAGHYVILALLGLLAAKMLATSLTMWIGGSGGVFAPSLFMGAMLGSAYGAVAHTIVPRSSRHAAGAYGLVGMGAVFAATSRAPITAVIIIFELTGDYRIILPLMFAIVVATALSNAMTRDTIYTLKLRRRGIDIDAPPPSSPMARSRSPRRWDDLPRAARPRAAAARHRRAILRRARQHSPCVGRRRSAARRDRCSRPRAATHGTRPATSPRAHSSTQRTDCMPAKPSRKPREHSPPPTMKACPS